MISFEIEVIKNTIEKLLKGEDYRQEVINSINVAFLDFSITFFKEIVSAKMESTSIDMQWYKNHFINNSDLAPEDSAMYAGMNKKSIQNIYGSVTKKIVLDAANANFDYLAELVSTLKDDIDTGLNISIKICYKEVAVELTLSESLLVINALATKKMAIRGGAWSSIGKKVEKPLISELCEKCGVPKEYIDDSIFRKDVSLDFDREIDYKIYNNSKKVFRVEVKLMGRGNPESADAIMARDTNIFVADTLSKQNRKQILSRGVEYLELKDNPDCLKDFKKILDKLDIPHEK